MEWYIVKQPQGPCRILTAAELSEDASDSAEDSTEQWGPFESEADAIARRVGLIRAGKCQPA
ncbi:MAG: hypothetical protein ACFB5Z_08990 [Elainellaceae cyanobacterium]